MLLSDCYTLSPGWFAIAVGLVWVSGIAMGVAMFGFMTRGDDNDA